jgi:hypothetical protein
MYLREANHDELDSGELGLASLFLLHHQNAARRNDRRRAIEGEANLVDDTRQAQ